MHRSIPILGRSLYLIVTIWTATQFTVHAAEPANAKLKGLLITGGCGHDYERQKVILTEGLSQRVSISWDVVHERDPNDRTYKISVLELAQAAGAPTEASWAKSVKFPATEKSVELFNGRDFDGWEGHTGKYFTVQDGVIVAKNSAENAPKVSTYLLTKKPYRNFRLVFEGKLVQSQMHSGISIWGRKYETGGETNSYQGHLVMFPTNWGFWDLYRRNSIYQDDGRARKADNVGGWNRMEILAIGSRIRLAVNGQEAADWTDPKPELCGEGPLGLQLHSNTVPQEVHFRGLILSENPEDRLITVEKK